MSLCCYECRVYLQQELDDPDSYSCISASEPQIEGPYWTAVMRFRAKNGFGALIADKRNFGFSSGKS